MSEQAEVTQAALVDAIIGMYHTTRLSETKVSAHILSKPSVQHALETYAHQARLEGERAGMEKAARIVEAEREFRRQCQERAKTKQEQRDFETMSIACTHVLTAIRNTGATK